MKPAPCEYLTDRGNCRLSGTVIYNYANKPSEQSWFHMDECADILSENCPNLENRCQCYMMNATHCNFHKIPLKRD